MTNPCWRQIGSSSTSLRLEPLFVEHVRAIARRRGVPIGDLIDRLARGLPEHLLNRLIRLGYSA